MARLQTTDVLMSFEEFLDWERHQELRHEFVDGVPIAMAGAAPRRTTSSKATYLRPRWPSCAAAPAGRSRAT
jgi:Uma2 family endonuclease